MSNIQIASPVKLDLKDLGLTENDMAAVQEVHKNLGEVSNITVAEYGKDISRKTNDCTKDILQLVQNKDLDETGKKLNEVLSVAQTINSSNLIAEQSGLSKLPLIGGLFKSASKAKQNFAMKFNDTNKQIDSLVDEIELNQKGLKDRVNLLDKMFENVQEDYHQLGLYIAAGQIKLQDIQKEIAELTSGNRDDNNVTQRIYDLNHIYNNFEKRLHDLHILQQSALQSLPMIRIIQSNNLMLVDKFHSIKNITIPAWKNQLTLAISLNEQENSVKLANAIDDTTNAILRKNAELLHSNSISTAKANQRSIIDPATLEFTQQTLIKTVNDVLQIQQNGMKERDAATVKLKQLQQNYDRIIIGDANQISTRKSTQ